MTTETPASFVLRSNSAETLLPDCSTGSRRHTPVSGRGLPLRLDGPPAASAGRPGLSDAAAAHRQLVSARRRESSRILIQPNRSPSVPTRCAQLFHSRPVHGRERGRQEARELRGSPRHTRDAGQRQAQLCRVWVCWRCTAFGRSLHRSSKSTCRMSAARLSNRSPPRPLSLSSRPASHVLSGIAPSCSAVVARGCCDASR